MKKDISLVSSKSFQIFGINIHKALIFFSIFVANKTFKSFFTKRDFIRYYYFINFYIFYLYRSFIFVKFLCLDFNINKFYNNLSIFIYAFKKIYIFLFIMLYFSVKSAFYVKFIASFMLIKLIIQ